MHLSEALSFVHRTGKRVHGDLTPRSIYVTSGGTWKLGGLGFSIPVGYGEQINCPYFTTAGTSQAARSTLFTYVPNLCYAAPELTKEPFKYDTSADMFSLGLIAMECFQLEHERGGVTKPVLDIRDGNPRTHAYQVEVCKIIQ